MTADDKQDKMFEFFDYSDSSFLIFFEFLSNLKFKNCFHWNESIRMKINAVKVLSQEVKTQYDKAIKEKQELEINKASSGIESTLLLIKFETLLNSVYSLCDNLAYISHKLHNGLPRSFNEQWSKKTRYRKLYPKYSDYLDIIDSISWYENLHTMRTEATHYLPGFVFHSENGLGILYRDMEHSDKRIEIDNIQEYMVTLHREINIFLTKYGDYHLRNFLKEDHKTFHPCLIPHPNGEGYLAGGRTITLKEYLQKKPGQCVGLDVPCQNRAKCPADPKKGVPPII